MSVQFKLYAYDGTTLVYTFPIVFSAPNFPHSEKTLIELSNLRGKGSIIIDGGESSYDFPMKFVLSGTDYYDLMSKVDALESAVTINTPFVLKINKTISSDYSYNVKRITPIVYQDDSLRTDFMEVYITLRVNAW